MADVWFVDSARALVDLATVRTPQKTAAQTVYQIVRRPDGTLLTTLWAHVGTKITDTEYAEALRNASVAPVPAEPVPPDQRVDPDLSAIAALTTTAYGRALLETANQAALKAAVGTTKGDVGLGSVDNTSDTAKPVSTAQQAALDLKIPLTQKGAASGVAPLDPGSRVPELNLPSNLAATSLAAAYVNKALPSYAGARVKTFDPNTLIYNSESPALRTIRSRLRGGMRGERATRVAFVGDSKTFGSGLTGGSYTGDDSWPAQFSEIIGASTGFCVANGSDFRYQSITGFAVAPANRNDLTTNAGGGSLTFNTRVACVGFKLYGYLSPGGTVTVTTDGGTPDTWTIAAGSPWRTFTKTGLSDATHSIAISTAATGFALRGIELTYANGSKVIMDNHGRQSSTASQWNDRSSFITYGTSTFDAVTTALPDVCIVNLGTNTPTSEADYNSLLDYIVTTKGIPTLLVVPGGLGGTAAESTYDARRQRIYDNADRLDLPVLDFGRVIGGYTAANLAGLMGDTTHENVRGYSLEALATSRALVVDAGVADGAQSLKATYAPARSLRPVAIETHVPTRNGSPNNLSDGVSTGITTQTVHTCQTAAAGLRLAYANYYNNNGVDADGPNNITVKASLKLSDATFMPVFFNGRRSVVIEPGATVVSDPIPASYLKGNTIISRTFVSVGATEKYPLGITTDASLGSGVVSGDSVDSGAIGASATKGYAPWAVLGTPRYANGTSPRVLLLGDSRVAGYGDTSGNKDAYGWARRAFDGQLVYLNVAVSGSTASSAQTLQGLRRRLALADACGTFTDVIVCYGVNDLTGGSTSAQVQTRLQACYDIFKDRGLRVWGATMAPVTTSTDTWATVGNQTPVASNANRITVNNWIRTTPTPLAGYFEFADAVESARDSGLWKATGSANGYTLDGTHESIGGYTAEAAVVNLATLGTTLTA